MTRIVSGIPKRSRESGVSIIEVMIASFILVISALSILGLVAVSIVSNNRNKMDSTGTMLAQSVVEQIKATLIGTGAASLTDCDGNAWVINTEPGGADLNGSRIDFTQTDTPDEYHMEYVLKSPCSDPSAPAEVYDLRWHVEVVGEADAMPTNTYEIYLGARKQNHSEGNMFYSLPVNFRVMAGN